MLGRVAQGRQDGDEVLCWTPVEAEARAALRSKYFDIAGQDDFSSDTDEGGWERT